MDDKCCCTRLINLCKTVQAGEVVVVGVVGVVAVVEQTTAAVESSRKRGTLNYSVLVYDQSAYLIRGR